MDTAVRGQELGGTEVGGREHSQAKQGLGCLVPRWETRFSPEPDAPSTVLPSHTAQTQLHLQVTLVLTVSSLPEPVVMGAAGEPLSVLAWEVAMLTLTCRVEGNPLPL